MTTYFHFAQLRLAAGSVIEPGNFGRLLRCYRPTLNGQGFGNAWLLCRELIFEQARPADKPSRWQCCYVVPSEKDVQCYRAANDVFRLQIVHEVEFTQPSLISHTGALSFLDMVDGSEFLEPERIAAQQYWSGAPGILEKGTEVLTASALRVIRSLE